MSRSSKPAPSKEAGPIDVTLSATLIGLIAFGVVMVYSASAVYANNMFGNGYHFFIRQTVFALLALVVLFVFTYINIDLLRRTTYPVLLLAVLLMIAVALGLGRSAGGATRWLAAGPVNVQPAELAKLAMILFVAITLALGYPIYRHLGGYDRVTADVVNAEAGHRGYYSGRGGRTILPRQQKVPNYLSVVNADLSFWHGALVQDQLYGKHFDDVVVRESDATAGECFFRRTGQR